MILSNLADIRGASRTAMQVARCSGACPVRLRQPRLVQARAVAPSGRASSENHLQLATAKLPAAVDAAKFVKCMYLLASGFKVSLLKSISRGEFASAGDLQATVEGVPGEGNVLFVRFFEGPASVTGRAPENIPQQPKARLESILSGLVDVPTIMQTMPSAIRKAVQVAMGPAPGA
ncbi:hypothetical protein V8C86DRAFT_1372208 [Haematococcus lacustris]